MFLRLVTFCFLAMCAVMSRAEFHESEPISYADNERCTLKVYHDANTAGLPVIVWFHGGSLTSGAGFIPHEIKDAGYVIVAPNYRLLPNVEVGQCIDDAAAAVAWVFKNIERYGGDPSKIFVTGHSAGGYLTSMVGLDKSWLAKYGVDADSIAGLIPFSGQAITHFSWRKMHDTPELQPTIDDTAPLYHVRPDAPPYVIICGDRELELFGRYEENAYMWRMMKLVGHPDVRIYELDGYNHGDMASPAFHILRDNVSRILRDKSH